MGRMVNHLTKMTAWAENRAVFFKHSTEVMLPTRHVPAPGTLAALQHGKVGLLPREGPRHTSLLLALQFKATLNLINLQLGGPWHGERGAEGPALLS